MTSIKIDQIIRSKRKSIALVVTRDARLVVRAPLLASRRHIEKLVSEKSDWILKRVVEAMSNRHKTKPKKFISGEKFLYLGKMYELQIVDDPKDFLKLGDKFFLSFGNRKQAKQIFIDWYKKSAKKIIPERVDLYASRHGFKYIKIRITSAQGRWGSCSHRGNLNFSWRLIMAPLEVIDYVIIHELAHLKHRNHSKKFWADVEVHCPNHKEHKKWLRENEGAVGF